MTVYTALSRRQLLSGSWQARDVDLGANVHAEPEITPTTHFYRELRTEYPQVAADTWGLFLGGENVRPLILSYADLTAMPMTEVACTLTSIGQRPGGGLIGHARWQGVPFRHLLAELNLPDDMPYVRILSADGRDTAVNRAHLNDSILALAINGERLPQSLGYPARMILPAAYDHLSPGWVTRIELREQHSTGFWERLGWSTAGEVQTQSHIEQPHPGQHMSGDVVFSGCAYAGRRQITAVEISIDDGPWSPVPFVPGEPGCWSRWSARWRAPTSGSYSLAVRATDETGFTQTPHASADPFPNGSSAIHRIHFHLDEART